MAPIAAKSNLLLNSRRSGVVVSYPASRSRKTLDPQSQTTINTNLSAHPRTNPTNALSVLLKLLTSLPSRIGGCQYKLTPAEHALSLHLVSIIDPFVYHGLRALAPPQHAQNQASASYIVSLVNQPTEILDAIIFHIDSRRDLLNVALGCKRLHDIVFPRHFEYRLIRCKVSSISVWNHLILHRSLARNVRRLEILDERSSASASGNSNKGRGIVVPKKILQGDTDLESTDDELSMHVKQEKYLAAALVRMTGLREFQWSCNHSPISIAHVWPTLMMRGTNLRVMEICDNMVFAPKVTGDEDEDEDDRRESESESEGESDAEGRNPSSCQGMLTRVPTRVLDEMRSVTFRSTPHSYGAAKQPELSHIAGMLHRCVNLKDLEITYISPRLSTSTGHQGTSLRTRPLADEFLMYSHWANLTSVILTNLRCASSLAPSTFLSAHRTLEVLHMDISINTGAGTTSISPLQLSPGSLPRLREIKASREIINAILECPLPPSSSSPSSCTRPLESVKGFKLSGNGNSAQQSSSRSIPDAIFLSNLKQSANTVRRIEMVGWHDMEDVKKLIACIPNVQHLDVGRRLGGATAIQRHTSSPEKGVAAPATNMVEWAELLATLPDLTSMHGVKFFYEVFSVASTTISPSNTNNNIAYSNAQVVNSSSGPSINRDGSPICQAALASKQTHPHTQMSLSMMERSRMRKNDEIAGVLAWKCKKLRRLDHWDESGGKVIVLLRDHEHGHAGGGMHGDEVGNGKERLTSTTTKVRWEVRRLKA